jgi:hypothetical protein
MVSRQLCRRRQPTLSGRPEQVRPLPAPEHDNASVGRATPTKIRTISALPKVRAGNGVAKKWIAEVHDQRCQWKEAQFRGSSAKLQVLRQSDPFADNQLE